MRPFQSFVSLGLLLWLNVPAISETAQALDLDRRATEIDGLIEKRLLAEGIKANPQLSDELFARRVYLDAVGRIPTLDELHAFLSSRSPDKRSMFIDSLLHSEGYVSHYFNYWADALRARNSTGNPNDDPLQNVQANYMFWIKQSLRENKPFDQFVRELLTTPGSLREHGATGYYLRDEGNRLANFEATTAVFLGIRLECAQCHDHPTESWSQRQYHEAEAFFNKNVSLRAPDDAVQEIVPRLNLDRLWEQERELLRQSKSIRMSEKSSGPKKGRSNESPNDPPIGLIDQEARRALGGYENYFVRFVQREYSALPKDFRGAGGEAGEKILPKTLFGDALVRKENQTWPSVYADWLTNPKLERFATVIANRLWAKLFGRGFAGQVDNVLEMGNSPDPQLFQLLTSTMRDVDFDMKKYLAILMRTAAYQRSASTDEIKPESPYFFPGPLLRRMTAEQIWDSMAVSLIDPTNDARIQRSLRSMEDIEALRKLPTEDAFWELMRSRASRRIEEGMAKKKKSSDSDLHFVRASELSSPAPNGHFLRLFGQSDRLLIDNAWINPTIPQALAMLNGPVLNAITLKSSPLMRAINKSEDHKEQVTLLFEAILSRKPSTHELRLVLAGVPTSRPIDQASLIWSLLNSRQFIFIQ